MLNRLAIALAALALAGCPSKSSSTPETTPDPTTGSPETTPEPEPSGTAASCLDVAVHVAETIESDGDPARFQDAITSVCTDGAWSAEARDCMASAPDDNTLEQCAKMHLSPEEYERAGEALEAAMEGS